MTHSLAPLNKRDLQELLGISERTLENWVRAGTIPPPRRLGGRRGWFRRLNREGKGDEEGEPEARLEAFQPGHGPTKPWGGGAGQGPFEVRPPLRLYAAYGHRSRRSKWRIRPSSAPTGELG